MRGPIVAVAITVGLLGMVGPAAATPITYNFSGTLLSGLGGNNSVTGQFTLDAATASITAFSLTTPAGLVTPANYTPLLVSALATTPNDNFVALRFEGNGIAVFDHLHLLFQTSLASFDGSTFFTGPVLFPGGNDGSSLVCNSSPLTTCSGTVFSSFTAGAATIQAPAAVPEPASLVLTTLGLAGLAWGRRRGRNS